jgi:ADP-ribose diphosphatase
MASERTAPTVKNAKWLTHSRLFHVEELELEFSNGATRVYERLNPGAHRAVMIVAMPDADTVLLAREYGAGIGDYYLSLPKGAVDRDENVLAAADRELKEEMGYGARQITEIKNLQLSPSYMGNSLTVVFATDLYEQKLPGDEPEEIEVIHYPVARLDELLFGDELREAYAIAALMLVRTALSKGELHVAG